MVEERKRKVKARKDWKLTVRRKRNISESDRSEQVPERAKKGRFDDFEDPAEEKGLQGPRGSKDIVTYSLIGVGDRDGDPDLCDAGLQGGEPADPGEEPVREVDKGVESMIYLVRLSQVEQQEELWPEGEFMSDIAKELDNEERQEQLARRQRHFWARDLLLSSMWNMIKERKMMLPFLKKFLIDRLNKVIQSREIIYCLIDKSVERAEERDRESIVTAKIGDGIGKSARRTKVARRRKSQKDIENEQARKKKENLGMGMRMMMWVKSVTAISGELGGKPQN